MLYHIISGVSLYFAAMYCTWTPYHCLHSLPSVSNTHVPGPGPLHFSHIADYMYDFCYLPDPDVDLSLLVCDVEYTSFHFGLCGRKFVLCLFGWQLTGVVHLSLQADGKVAFENIPVFGICCPACHDSSLYLFVLVLFLEAVVLSQVHVALDIFYQHIGSVRPRRFWNGA